MREARDLAPVRRADELRLGNRPCRGRRRRLAILACGCLLTLALGATLLWPPRPLLVWNASASSPLGLYQVLPPRLIGRGDSVVAWLPETLGEFAARRRYLPAGVPLVKRVAAISGDRVCAIGEGVYVNGRQVAVRRNEDRLGRPLPWWTGCARLAPGDLFLLMPQAPGSFDGRYFGITRAQQVVGRSRLIWPR